MRKLVYCLLFMVYGAILSFAYPIEAQTPVLSAQELIEEAKSYDGKIVVYEGEVIGDKMIRAGYAWINVRDQSGAIGIFCPQELVHQIEHQGSYRYSGDVISVEGVFHRFCPQHGGDIDIHAHKISIIRRGEQRLHPLESGKVKAGIILAAIACGLAIIYLIVARFR